ncbi:MAG TPA: aminoacyl-tRNA hydrolase [Candidatus Synoicihabitans sp.]|nr:aminoacyl-tRNA hydrolase [Candidatus Synoicihabitans sp.]
MSITLVVGLGNPGREYADTRHNLGWRVLDALAAREKLVWKNQPSFEAEVARWERPGQRPVLLAKPLTYMNESGRAVRALASYFKVANAAIAAVYDDLTIPLGLLKVSDHGSAGGHNGVASLLELLGDGFIRFRLGIGPKTPAQMDLKDFVLGKFSSEQNQIVEQHLPTFVSGLGLLIDSGPSRAMNSLNRRVQHEPEHP